MSDLRERLRIDEDQLRAINDFLLDPRNEVVNGFLEVVERYGTPEEINAKAAAARDLNSLLDRLRQSGSPYLADIEWLTEQRDKGAFISIDAFRKKVLGDRAATMSFDEKDAVTLEISALQFFPWLIAEAKQAIENGELMPGRYIRVRNMVEQVADNGDILAVAAAMQIVGASYVETLDTKGTDGSNIHLGGPETIVTHPATTTHAVLSPEDRAELGIKDGLIRLSAGLEDTEDVIADLLSALSTDGLSTDQRPVR